MINNFNKIKPLQDKINNLLLDIKDIKPSLYKEYSSIVNQSINNFIDLGIEYIEKNPQEFEIFLSKLNDIIKILTFIKTKENISENILKKLIREILQEKEDRCKRIADRRYDKPSAYKSGAIVRCRKGKIWKDLKEEVENIPQFLYHATYKPLLKKIKERGLDTSDSKKAWDDSIPGYVYLALDPYVAESYAEESEMVPESWLDNIIILKVDTSKLDKSKLFIDQNVQDNEGDTLEYRGVIPWEALSLKTLNEDESLHKWFKRQGPKGKEGGWVDCNAPDGKGGYKACGRKEGEKRSKYPSCRPTPAKCKTKGKGKKWGKTK